MPTLPVPCPSHWHHFCIDLNSSCFIFSYSWRCFNGLSGQGQHCDLFSGFGFVGNGRSASIAEASPAIHCTPDVNSPSTVLLHCNNLLTPAALIHLATSGRCHRSASVASGPRFDASVTPSSSMALSPNPNPNPVHFEYFHRIDTDGKLDTHQCLGPQTTVTVTLSPAVKPSGTSMSHHGIETGTAQPASYRKPCSREITSPLRRYTTSIATNSAPYTRLLTTSALAQQSQHRNANPAPAR